jgi:PHD/YefM family antitoxin component YafN of YafNO toxin-antitoxin module
MAIPLHLEEIDALPRTPASDVKKLGWRALMKAIARTGQVVVTNHDEPQAVILSTQTYDAILEALRQLSANDDAALETLRRRFDARLSALSTRDAGNRLRTTMRKGAKLSGKVKAGATY